MYKMSDLANFDSTFLSTTVSQTSIDTASMYHKIQTITTLTISALLIPINALLIGALSRPKNIRRPMTWLFLHVALFDIVFLISRLAWNYDKQKSKTAGPGCGGVDLFWRILEKSSEDASGYMTSAVAVLRAVVVWRSAIPRRTKLTSKIALLLSLIICLISFVGSSTLIVLTCGKIIGCADGLNPLYGPPQAAHSLAHVLLVNVPVFACYTYVCSALIRRYRSVKFNIANRPSHLKALKYLIPYTLVHTLLTTPSHLNMIVHPGCLQGSKADALELEIDNVINTIWVVAVTGLNPLLLYLCNESLRRSVSGIIAPLLSVRSCRSDNLENARQDNRINEHVQNRVEVTRL